MPQLDSASKKFFANNQVFATIYNLLLPQTGRTLEANLLRDYPTEIPVPFLKDAKSGSMKSAGHPRFLDVCKSLTVKQTDNCILALLGLEIQSYIDYAMPVRCMFNTVLVLVSEIEKQIRKHQRHTRNRHEFLSGYRKDDRILPVITAVVYLGSDPWDGPTSLEEMFVEDETLKPLVPSYKLNLLCLNELDHKMIENSCPDIAYITKCIKLYNEKDKLAEELIKIREDTRILPDTFVLASVMSGVSISLENTQGKVAMTETERKKLGDYIAPRLLDHYYKKGNKEGRKEGLEKGLEKGREEGLEKGRMETGTSMLAAFGRRLLAQGFSLKQAIEESLATFPTITRKMARTILTPLFC